MFHIDLKGPALLRLPMFCGISIEEHAEYGPRGMWVNPITIQAIEPHSRFNEDRSEQRDTSKVYISTTYFEIDMPAQDLVDHIIAKLCEISGVQKVV